MVVEHQPADDRKDNEEHGQTYGDESGAGLPKHEMLPERMGSGGIREPVDVGY